MPSTAARRSSPGATAERSSCDDIPKCVGVQRDDLRPARRRRAHRRHRSAVTAAVTGRRRTSPRSPRWVEELGLAWAVTEFDVPLPSPRSPTRSHSPSRPTPTPDALGACIDVGLVRHVRHLGHHRPPATRTGRHRRIVRRRAVVRRRRRAEAGLRCDGVDSRAVADGRPDDRAGADNLRAGAGHDHAVASDADNESGVAKGLVIGGLALCAIAAVVGILRRRR